MMRLHPDVGVVRLRLWRGQQDKTRVQPGRLVCPVDERPADALPLERFVDRQVR